MKLILTLALIWTLFNTAEALQCQTCTSSDPQCTNTTSHTCPSDSDQRCVTAAIKATNSTQHFQRILKSCVPSSHCSDNTTYSENFGFASLAASLKCCNTDGCNSETLPFPTDQASNSLQCFSCDSMGSTECNSKIQCVGMEDRCFSGRVTDRPYTFPTFGCASANLCDHLTTLPDGFTHFTSGPNCCQGNLCNSAWAVKLSVFPLLLGLFTLTFIC
ncbi:phospholipase A2 inhibitor and Ly6/PLAUR domain-containing protein-like [Centroberyx gerrardi]